jgi:hypothetical protein
MNRIIICLILVLLAAGTLEAKEWRGIIPLHSSRTDVERLLGPPTMDRLDTVVYEYAGERASIEFSRGPCTVEFSSWNVPRDIVISIWVTPKLSELRIADLGIAQRKFKKILDEHRPQIAYYRNEEDGIEYSVDDESGKVGLVNYFPSASDQRLRCPEPRNRLSETIRFAQYSNISFAAERKILDRFAQQITRYTSINYASAQAYILAYWGKRQTVSDATSRAERAKKYLVKRHQIDPDRIETINAGYRKKPTVELYLVPPGGDPPLLSSTIPGKRE